MSERDLQNTVAPNPKLAVDFCGIKMKNPIIAASGTFGNGPEYAGYLDLTNQVGAISVKGLTPKGTAERIQKVLKTYGLPFECGLTLGTLTEAIALDKKNLNGNLNVILLHEIGDSYIEATDIQFFAETARLV